MTVTFCDCCGAATAVMYNLQSEGRGRVELCLDCRNDLMDKATVYKRLKETKDGQTK